MTTAPCLPGPWHGLGVHDRTCPAAVADGAPGAVIRRWELAQMKGTPEMSTDTDHAAQGHTTDHVHVQVTGNEPARMYVGETRAQAEAADPDAPIPYMLTPAAEAYLDAELAEPEAEAEAGL